MTRQSRYRLVDLSTASSGLFEAGGEPVVGDTGRADRLVALVPADRCSVARVALPEMSSSRMAQALRWAVEDQIAGDPESQHVVPIRREADGRLACLVVARDDMERWLAELPSRPARMVPDAACLPRATGELALLPAGDHVLARAGETTFDRLEPGLLDTFVPELRDHAGDPGRVVWLGDDVPAELGDVDLERRPLNAEWLGLLAPGALGAEGERFDLMRGEFGAADRTAAPRQWRFAGWLAALAVFLAFAVAMSEYVVLERERGRLDAAVEERLDTLFPEIGRIVRPRAQVERALAGLRGNSGDRFVRLAAAAGPVFSGASGVVLESMAYAEGRLEIELRTPSLADLEALQRQLRAQGLPAELRDVAVSDDGTSGRIEIAEPAS
ncbi:MAG: type II secretion system protein GspL [Candidatus Wenzhouxiangella sp. M2_3B_020]